MSELSDKEIQVKSAVAEICEDLDDLREALINALTHYESRLKYALKGIPSWAEVQSEDIHSLYKIDDIEDALLGPRSVAILAQTMEDHVEEWLGFPGNIVAKKLSDKDVARYRKSCAEVERKLLDLVNSARRTTADATLKLGEILDRIMNRVRDEREKDENALKDLVGEGSVERGRSAQVEIANLWETYREHAEVLTQVWEELESLAFEGTDLIIAGVEDIRWIMHQSEDALGLLNIELCPTFEIEDIPIRDETRSTFEISREPEVIFDATSPKEESKEEEVQSEIEPRETIELERHRSEIPKFSEQSEISELSEQEDHQPEACEENSEKIDLTGLSEISELVEQFSAERTTQKVDPVPLFEVLLWFIVLLILCAFCALRILNPAIISRQNIPFLNLIMIGAGLFVLGVPFIRRWRFLPMPSLRVEESEDIPVEIDSNVNIGNVVYKNEDFNLQRWTDQHDASFGWQLFSEDIVIIGPETNLTRWQSSSSKIFDKHENAAHLSKSKFRILCRALSIDL